MFRRLKWGKRNTIIGALALLVVGLALALGVSTLFLGGSTDDDSALGSEVDELVPIPTHQPTPSPTPVPPPPPSEAPPARLIIDKIGVDAPIATLSVDEDLIPEVPAEGQTVAWYDFSSKPQHGSNVVFSGHVTWDKAPAVFWELDSLEKGDLIRVKLEDEAEIQYRVTQVRAVEWDDPEAVELIWPTPDEMITIVTCGGTWIPDPNSSIGGNYTHRTVVRAEPVTELTAGGSLSGDSN